MGYFVDYISFTIHVDTAIPGMAMAFFYKYVNLEIEEGNLQHGMNGYKQSIVFPSGIRILFDGAPGMGVHVIVPGLGLKSEHLDFNVFELVGKFKTDGMKYNISRIDVAIDSDIDFGYFLNKFNRKQFDCRYSEDNIKKYVDVNNRGTLYFGKRGGMTMFRIYDKAKEQGVDGVWTRMEMECRGDACEQIVEALRASEVNKYFLGHLRFVNQRCSDMSRAITCKRYLEMLENPAERKKVHKKKGDNTLEWFVSQVAPTVKALEKEYGNDYIRRVIDDAKISRRQAKERFDIRVLNNSEGVNIKTGEIIRLSEEYTQLCLDMLEGVKSSA